MITALDASVIVAAVASWHEEHAAARGAIAVALREETLPVVPTRALVESFCVLTRLPPGYRISPADAAAVLRGSLEGRTRIVGDDGAGTWPLLADAAAAGIAGGALYDFEILRAAKAAGAQRLLTLNPGDFERFDVAGVVFACP